MKFLIASICLLTVSFCLQGQVTGKFYLDSQEVTVNSDTPDHIEFAKSSTSLSENDEAYLQYIIDHHTSDVLSKKKCMIVLESVAGSTEENTLNNKTGQKRVEAISKFLLKKSKIIVKKAIMDGTRIACSIQPLYQ